MLFLCVCVCNNAELNRATNRQSVVLMGNCTRKNKTYSRLFFMSYSTSFCLFPVAVQRFKDEVAVYLLLYLYPGFRRKCDGEILFNALSDI